MSSTIGLISGLFICFLLGSGTGYFIVNILAEIVSLPNFIFDIFSKEKMSVFFTSIIFSCIFGAIYQNLPFGSEKWNTIFYLIGLALYVVGDKDRIVSGS